MDKIWILKLGKTYRIAKTKRELLRKISQSSNWEVHEYDLVSKSRASDFLKQGERDQQLRSVLGEVSDFESCAIDFINMYEKIAPDGKTHNRWSMERRAYYSVTEKGIFLEKLRKFSIDKEEFKSILIDYKSYFFNISQDPDWLFTILKCHNFTNCTYYLTKNSKFPDKLEENFKIAKEKLKLWRKNKK